jgi:PHS family inorganic phosphate transporter-like MFS transporter
MMAVTFVLLAFVPNLEKLAAPFLIIYGLSFFFTEFGPNATTFVYPSEIFPCACAPPAMGSPPPWENLAGSRVYPIPVPFALEGIAWGRGGSRVCQHPGRHCDLDHAPRNQGQEPGGDIKEPIVADTTNIPYNFSSTSGFNSI